MLKSFAILSICTAALWAQSFDTASVKRAAPGSGSDAVPVQQSPTRITCQGVTLKTLLALAYGVTAEQIAGPNGWVTKSSISSRQCLRELRRRRSP